MNYIARLQAQLATAQADLAVKAAAIQTFRVHLVGDKFAGAGPNGSRNDWIAVTDVKAWLEHIADAGG